MSCFKSVLREDKNNYMALIFLGVSILEIGPAEKAEKAFMRATELNPTNVLGWNGLVNYYDRLDKWDVGLIDAYFKVIEIEG